MAGGPKRIEVWIQAAPMASKAPLTPAEWERRIVTILRAAGIPMTDAGPTHGTLQRFDDPKDFGASIWEWTP